MPEQMTEPTGAEIEETSTEPVATTEQQTTTTSELLNSDAFVEKVADRVFDKMKGFTDSLVKASETAAEIAAEMLPVDQTPPDAGPPPEGQPQEAPPQDVQPSRRHKMFAQPFKRKGE